MLSEMNRRIGRRKWIDGIVMSIIDIDWKLLKVSPQSAVVGLDSGGRGAAAAVTVVRIGTGQLVACGSVSGDNRNSSDVMRLVNATAELRGVPIALGWDAAIPDAWHGQSVADHIQSMGRTSYTIREGQKLGLARVRGSLKTPNAYDGLIVHAKAETLIDDLLAAEVASIEGEHVNWADHSRSHTIDALRYALAYMVKPSMS